MHNLTIGIYCHSQAQFVLYMQEVSQTTKGFVLFFHDTVDLT